MKKIFIASMLCLSAAWASGKMKDKMLKELTYNINPESTQIQWIGKKVTGQHDGKVKVKSGKLMISKSGFSSGEIIVDMNSISVDDIKDKKGNAKLVGHLKSDDFFATDKFKTAKLQMTKVTKKKAKYEVQGNLTIKDITKPITFMADLAISKSGTATLTADIKVNRTLYGVKYGSGKFFDNLGDRMINDEFTLKIKATSKI